VSEYVSVCEYEGVYVHVCVFIECATLHSCLPEVGPVLVSMWHMLFRLPGGR